MNKTVKTAVAGVVGAVMAGSASVAAAAELTLPSSWNGRHQTRLLKSIRLMMMRWVLMLTGLTFQLVLR